MESIEKLILQLENDLLKSEIRKSPQKINEILKDDFIEFTSSGGEYHYIKLNSVMFTEYVIINIS